VDEEVLGLGADAGGDDIDKVDMVEVACMTTFDEYEVFSLALTF
jgi:hypothetical protein